jgi:pantetheine-phosphate adenylyltransferase
MKNTAVYAGSFDPITNGHVDIIERGIRIFEGLTILVAYNPNKASLFSVEERVSLIKEVIRIEDIKGGDRISVDCFDGLLVDYAKKSGSNVILRGLRAVSDFEYEFQMALINRRLNRDVETTFLMTGYKWFYTSSNLIKEAASLGGTVKGLVPDILEKRLKEKYMKDGAK